MTYRIVGHSSDRTAWENRRHESIGASVAANLWADRFPDFFDYGWDTLLDAKVRRVSLAKERPEKHDMWWGTKLERIVCEALNEGYDKDGNPLLRWGYANANPAEPFPCMLWGEHLVFEELPFISCTPDAVAGHGLLVEIKAPRSGSRGKYWRGGVPLSIWMQCQHQILVTGADQVTVAAAFGGRGNVHLFPVEPDLAWQDEHLARCCEFWDSVEKARNAMDQEEVAQ